jgi:hypothetical protein
MNILRKLRRWCPQPKTPVPTNFTRLSTPIFAGALLAEIVILLIVPMAYYALLVPKNMVVAPDQTLPLTNSQIKAAWPNLPTAQQIFKNGGCELINSNTPAFNDVKNHTRISPVNAIPRASPPPSDHVVLVRLAPVEYFIWLQLNSTTWVSPGQQYLATNNPPYVLSSPYYTEQVGFLGTGLPAAYAVIAVIAIGVTLAAGATYLSLHKKGIPSRIAGE